MICSLIHDDECNLGLSRIGIVRTNGGGSNENIPIVCQQCHDPICAKVCVMGAILRNEETGAIIVKEDLCVGCKGFCQVIFGFCQLVHQFDAGSAIFTQFGLSFLEFSCQLVFVLLALQQVIVGATRRHKHTEQDAI